VNEGADILKYRIASLSGDIERAGRDYVEHWKPSRHLIDLAAAGRKFSD
jgi:hypothetical protein